MDDELDIAGPWQAPDFDDFSLWPRNIGQEIAGVLYPAAFVIGLALGRLMILFVEWYGHGIL